MSGMTPAVRRALRLAPPEVLRGGRVGECVTATLARFLLKCVFSVALRLFLAKNGLTKYHMFGES